MMPLEWDTKLALIEPLYKQIIDILDPKPERSGVQETPLRVAKAWQHWVGGYDIDPESLIKTFDDGAEKYDEMVVVRNVPFYSHCEHHFAPFFGKATVAYIPGDRIIGLSKLARIVDAYSRRFQCQERITVQIAELLGKLNPIGIGVYLQAEHLCMSSRGARVHGSDTVTTAFRGALKEQPMARAEFLALCK
jgi:GTP cyclohydrolase I